MTTLGLSHKITAIGKEARAKTGAEDVKLAKLLKWAGTGAELTGRALMCFMPGFWPWLIGTSLVGFDLSVESQLNHSIMHGAYLGLPGVGRYTPDDYETLAIPFQSKTWREAHRIHHAHPSLLEDDPDTMHPLFRVHENTSWRPWHLLNTFIGAIFVFECWAFDYDRFLKKKGLRSASDRGEIRKFSLFLAYQYGLWAILAGPRWKQVLLGTLIACIMRNFVFTGLQTCSSVGNDVSTLHNDNYGRKSGDAWCKFQIESSKNFIIRSPFWRAICGGLDRHIEHHLYPNLPPNRLYPVSAEIREICRSQSLHYSEYPSFLASLKDTLTYLWKLSFPRRIQ